MKILLIPLLAICSVMAFFTSGRNKTPGHTKNQTNNDASSLTISIDNTSPGIKIPSDFLGLSYEIGSIADTINFRSNHTKYINLINGLGNGVLRLNGYYTNFISWGNHKRTMSMIRSHNDHMTDSLATSDIDSLFAFMKLTNWRVIFGLNFLHSNPDDVASEVSYAWPKYQSKILAFEIGNEPESAFKSNFLDYYNAIHPYFAKIRSLTPQAPFCGPASLYPWRFPNAMMRFPNDKVDFITVHLYSVGESRVPNSIDMLLDEKYINRADTFTRHVDAIVSKKNLSYRIDECNNFGDEGANVSDRFASALWGIDYMFTVAANHAIGINFHGGTRNFTPIIVAKNTPVTPQPLYYAMLFFHLASQGNLLPVNINGNNSKIKAYAVLGQNKKVYVTLINKDTNNASTVKLSLKTAFNSASLIRLSSPDVTSKDSVTLGGASVDKYGNWKATDSQPVTAQNGSFSVNLPKGSATLVTLVSN